MLKKKDTQLIVENWRRFINEDDVNESNLIEENFKANVAKALVALNMLMPGNVDAKNSNIPPHSQVKKDQDINMFINSITNKELKGKIILLIKENENVKDPDGWGDSYTLSDIIKAFLKNTRNQIKFDVGFIKTLKRSENKTNEDLVKLIKNQFSNDMYNLNVCFKDLYEYIVDNDLELVFYRAGLKTVGAM